MAILEIKHYPDPILKKKSEEIKEITPEIKRVAQDMIETLEKAEGVGLAAPQVGILKRIIVVKTENGPVVFLNPKILKKSKLKEIKEEGCLCFPGIYLKIRRAQSVFVEAQKLSGEKVQFLSQNLLARILQHEIDHLGGKLILDRISFWERQKVKKDLKSK